MVRPLTLFAVMTVHGPGWDPARSIREQDLWDEHAAFMDGLVESGFVAMGGPLADGDHALLAVEAGSEGEVRERMAADPWAASGHLEISEVHEWSIWLGRHPAGS